MTVSTKGDEQQQFAFCYRIKTTSCIDCRQPAAIFRRILWHSCRQWAI